MCSLLATETETEVDNAEQSTTQNPCAQQPMQQANTNQPSFFFSFNNLNALKQSSNNKIHQNIRNDINDSALNVKNQVQDQLIRIFNDIASNLWNSKMEDGLDKIRNEICQ